MVFSARRLLVAALLVVAAVIWVRINKPVEGDVLLELTSRHGVTTADLLSVVALAMAVVIAWPSWRRPEPGWTPPPGGRGGPSRGTYARDRIEADGRGPSAPTRSRP